MNIVFISLGFAPLRLSGLDVSGDRLVAQLLAAGHSVTVVAGQRAPMPEAIQHPALRVARVPLDPSNWIGFGWRAARLAAALPAAEVVHFWDVHFGWAYRGRFVASLQHSFRQRLGAWTWNSAALPRTAAQRLYYLAAQRLAEAPALRRAAGLLAGSATAQREFQAEYQLAPGRIWLARHGVDTHAFQPDPVGAAALRRQWGIGPAEPVIAFAGFVTPRKGLEYLARALRQMAPTPRLVIAGRWAPQFRAQFLAELGPLAGRVVEAGFVPDAQMPAFFSLAQVYVSASLLEGFGLPLAEALACGTPVVAAAAGATAEVVGPGGRLVPPRDPAALAAAVSELLADSDERQRLGAAGRAHVLANFSLETMTADMLAGYQAFLG